MGLYSRITIENGKCSCSCTQVEIGDQSIYMGKNNSLVVNSEILLFTISSVLKGET